MISNKLILILKATLIILWINSTIIRADKYTVLIAGSPGYNETVKNW